MTRSARASVLNPADSISLWYEIPVAQRIWLAVARLPLWLYAVLGTGVAGMVGGGVMVAAGDPFGLLATGAAVMTGGSVPVAAGAAFGLFVTGAAALVTLAASRAAMLKMAGSGKWGGQEHLEAALLQMGAVHPRRYLRRNAGRLRAFDLLKAELADCGVKVSFHVALLAFCFPGPSEALATVPALVRDRGVTDHRALLALLVAGAGTPSAVRSGVL